MRFHAAAIEETALHLVQMIEEDIPGRLHRLAFYAVGVGGDGANGNLLLDNRGADDTSGAYHLVWSRDLYQIATALLAAGDRSGAERALTYLLERQQKPDGSFPQNSYVNGTQRWENVQLDEVAFPMVMAWQLGRNDGATYRDHIKKAADYIVANGPATPQERWENQGGYSPATIAAEIAGLVCAADIARTNGDRSSANRYLRSLTNGSATSRSGR